MCIIYDQNHVELGRARYFFYRTDSVRSQLGGRLIGINISIRAKERFDQCLSQQEYGYVVQTTGGQHKEFRVRFIGWNGEAFRDSSEGWYIQSVDLD